jgi:hypothetical protein
MRKNMLAKVALIALAAALPLACSSPSQVLENATDQLEADSPAPPPEPPPGTVDFGEGP